MDLGRFLDLLPPNLILSILKSMHLVEKVLDDGATKLWIIYC